MKYRLLGPKHLQRNHHTQCHNWENFFGVTSEEANNVLSSVCFFTCFFSPPVVLLKTATKKNTRICRRENISALKFCYFPGDKPCRVIFISLLRDSHKRRRLSLKCVSRRQAPEMLLSGTRHFWSDCNGLNSKTSLHSKRQQPQAFLTTCLTAGWERAFPPCIPALLQQQAKQNSLLWSWSAVKICTRKVGNLQKPKKIFSCILVVQTRTPNHCILWGSLTMNAYPGCHYSYMMQIGMN